MTNTIKLKRGSGSDPSASDMVVGEPVLRSDTAELFFKKDDGSVAKVSGGGSGGSSFQYLALRNAANDGAASYPGNDFTLVTSGTTTAVSPATANALILSYGGVVQKPNSGTSTSGITGFIVDGSRLKTATNFAAAPDFIVYQESGGIGEPSDNTVTSAKIVDGAIVNADINASAAIAGTKIAPNFGSQNIVTTGDLTIDTDTLKVDSTNNRVGINEASPGKALEIVSAQNSDGINILKGSNSSVFLGHNGTGDEGLLQLKDGGTTKIQIYGETGQTSYFNAGNVGIGTTSPSRSLHVSNNGSDGTQLQLTGTLDSAGIKFVPASGDVFEYQAVATGCYIAYNRTDSRGDIFVDGTGKVGIGTTSISELLQIGNDSGTPGGLKIAGQSSSVTDEGLTIDWTSSNEARLFSESSGDATIHFYTTSSGTRGERLRIDSNGNVKITDGNLIIGTAGHGIDFSATSHAGGSASELLDDYESGTWTASVATGTCSQQSCNYVKVGSLVTIWGRIHGLSDTTTNASLRITGLPYTCNTSNAGGVKFSKHISIDANTAYITTAEELSFYGHNSANAWTYVTHASCGSNMEIYFHASYTSDVN